MRFCWHQWGNWTDIGSTSSAYGYVYQIRHCLKCFKAKMRSTWAG